MSGWRWIDKRALLLLHDESLAEHGGAAGLRDEGLLESALAGPQHRASYGNPDLAELAAAYGVGLGKNHPFIDGNKRVAFLAVGVFLALNGQRLVATQAEARSRCSASPAAKWKKPPSRPGFARTRRGAELSVLSLA